MSDYNSEFMEENTMDPLPSNWNVTNLETNTNNSESSRFDGLTLTEYVMTILDGNLKKLISEKCTPTNIASFFKKYEPQQRNSSSN